MGVGGGDEGGRVAERLGGGRHGRDRLVVQAGAEQRDPGKGRVPLRVVGSEAERAPARLDRELGLADQAIAAAAWASTSASFGLSSSARSSCRLAPS